MPGTIRYPKEKKRLIKISNPQVRHIHVKKLFKKLCKRQRENIIRDFVKKHIDEINKSGAAKGYDFYLRKAEFSTGRNGENFKTIFKTCTEERRRMHKMSKDDALFVKDMGFVSDEKYAITTDTMNKAARTNESIQVQPSLSTIERHRSKINDDVSKSFKISASNIIMADTKEKILEQLDFFLADHPHQEKIVPKPKIGADGTPVGNHSITNYVFTIINDKEICKSCAGNFTLGLTQGPENYEELQKPLNTIMDAIETFKSHKNIPIEYYFCSDMKIQHLSNGLKSASSSHPCPYCEIHYKSLHLLLEKPVMRTKLRAALALGSKCMHGKCKKMSKKHGYENCADEKCTCRDKV